MEIIQGFKTYRHKNNKLEQKFHEEFISQHLNDVNTIIYGHDSTFEPNNKLTDKEKCIVLTAIQWLGSPIGQNFITQINNE